MRSNFTSDAQSTGTSAPKRASHNRGRDCHRSPARWRSRCVPVRGDWDANSCRRRLLVGHPAARIVNLGPSYSISSSRTPTFRIRAGSQRGRDYESGQEPDDEYENNKHVFTSQLEKRFWPHEHDDSKTPPLPPINRCADSFSPMLAWGPSFERRYEPLGATSAFSPDQALVVTDTRCSNLSRQYA